MYSPSGVGCRVGVALRWYGVTTVRDARNEMAISMPWVSAWWRYPWVVVGSCADMEGMGRDVVDCIRRAVRHHGAQCVSPLRSDRRRGGRMRYLVGVEGLSGCVRKATVGIDCRRRGL